MNKIAMEGGGATVEVAILSMVMVPIVLYSIFFFDLSLMNVRILEAARYAAWEFSVMEISDWIGYSHMNGISDDTIKMVSDEVNDRWGDDMNSATSSSNMNAYPGVFNEKISGLTVTELDQKHGGDSCLKISVDDTSAYLTNFAAEPPSEESSPGNISNVGSDNTIVQEMANKFSEYVNKGANWVFGTWLKFNVKGFIEVKASTKLKFTRTAPIYKGESLLLGGVPIVGGQQKLLVDSWDLKDGRDADYFQGEALAGDGGAGKKYYNQVNNLVFGGFKGQLDSLLGKAGDTVKDILNKLKIRNPFEPIVRSYALRGSTGGSDSGCSSAQKNEQSCIIFGEGQDGGRANPVTGAPAKFYTNVFKDTHTRDDSPYFRVYQKNGAGYYMGCDEPQIVDRQKCWQN